jgi:hypothetical protein
MQIKSIKSSGDLVTSVDAFYKWEMKYIQ